MTFKGGSSLMGGGELVAAINASSAPSRTNGDLANSAAVTFAPPPQGHSRSLGEVTIS